MNCTKDKTIGKGILNENDWEALDNLFKHELIRIVCTNTLNKKVVSSDYS